MAVHGAAHGVVGQRPHLDLALGCAGSRPWSLRARAQGEPELWHDWRVLVAYGVPELQYGEQPAASATKDGSCKSVHPLRHIVEQVIGVQELNFHTGNHGRWHSREIKGCSARQSANTGEDHVWFEDRWMVASLYDE
jgi:hypothetical protein